MANSCSYSLVIWWGCMTERRQTGVSSKTYEVSMIVEDSRSYLFWGFICISFIENTVADSTRLATATDQHWVLCATHSPQQLSRLDQTILGTLYTFQICIWTPSLLTCGLIEFGFLGYKFVTNENVVKLWTFVKSSVVNLTWSCAPNDKLFDYFLSRYYAYNISWYYSCVLGFSENIYIFYS